MDRTGYRPVLFFYIQSFFVVNWTFWVMNLRKKVSCGHLG